MSRRTNLPNPPNPQAYVSLQSWAVAAFTWMQNARSRIEQDSASNSSPAGPFVVGTFTPTTTISGTDATSNFVATLVNALNDKGVTTPTENRTTI